MFRGLLIVALMVGGPLAVIFLGQLALRLYRWRCVQSEGRHTNDTVKCARCGYSLTELEIPRCPECGALRGFTKPLSALGLAEEEIREGFARQKARREQQPAPDEEEP